MKRSKTEVDIINDTDILLMLLLLIIVIIMMITLLLTTTATTGNSIVMDVQFREENTTF